MRVTHFLEKVTFPDDNGGQPYFSRHTAVDTIMKKMTDGSFGEFCNELKSLTTNTKDKHLVTRESLDGE
jgi:hypothetical protein